MELPVGRSAQSQRPRRRPRPPSEQPASRVYGKGLLAAAALALLVPQRSAFVRPALTPRCRDRRSAHFGGGGQLRPAESHSRWQTARAAARKRSDSFQQLSPREHVLLRPDMYIGPVETRDETHWILKGKSRMEEAPLTISPGFVQIFNEILVNAADRQFDSMGGPGMSEIRVDMDQDRISVWSDGGPIPIEQKKETGMWIPTMVFSQFLSGNNFDDSKKRFIGGRNGVGAKATNTFSKLFEVEVVDPKGGKLFRQRWENNMEVAREPEVTALSKDAPSNGGVRVTFHPDLERFGLKTIDKDHMQLLKARVFDTAACVRSNIAVYLNGKQVAAQSFRSYAEIVLGKDIAVTTIKDAEGRPRAEVAAALSTDGHAALGFVNAIRCSAGTHVQQVSKQIVQGINVMTPGRKKPSSAAIMRHVKLVVKALVDNPDFDSQTKSKLTTTPSKLGYDPTLPREFIDEVAKMGVLDAVLRNMKLRDGAEMQKALSGQGRLPPKLEDALNAGKGNCTLIVTEGDSAKALAVAGVSQWDRENYGIFPLRGKVLNIRTANRKQIQNNNEVKSLLRIIGLEWGREYKNDEDLTKSLRYQHLMIFSDQDLDGDHIAGLIINFITAGWPSLLEIRPDFIRRFATPILKVFAKNAKANSVEKRSFLTEGEFERWKEENPGWSSKHRVKYYKGLGTSTRAEAIRYFKDADRHQISFTRDGRPDDASVELAFAPGMEDQRKQWILDGLQAEELDYTRPSASFKEFINQQLVKFSTYDTVRSLPLLIDGMKPSQRKVMHVARTLKGEMRVSQLTGRIIEQTAYHHGESSLEGAIVHMAQNFVGTNNVNLLEPVGMFGSRLAGRDEHAASRYIHTHASDLATVVFRKEDDGLVPPGLVDGKEVEPPFLLPVVPIVLLNGFKGIGTGWATQGPNYDPLQVADSLEQLIKGEPLPRLLPSYRGFRGNIWQDGDTVVSKVFSEGVWKLHKDADFTKNSLYILEIQELPVQTWTDDFIGMLRDRQMKNVTMPQVYKCSDHTDQSVHLLLGLTAQELEDARKKAGNTKDVVAALGIHFRLRTSIQQFMWLFHKQLEDGEAQPHVPQLFDSPETVIREFHSVRRVYYVHRKTRLVSTLQYEVDRLRNQVRFTREYEELEGLLKGDEEKVDAELETLGFKRLAPRSAGEDAVADFDYLLKMSFLALTLEKADAMEDEYLKKEAQLREVKATSEDEMWLRDIEDFRQAYKKEVSESPPLVDVSSKELEDFRRRLRKAAGKGQKRPGKPMVVIAQTANDGTPTLPSSPSRRTPPSPPARRTPPKPQKAVRPPPSRPTQTKPPPPLKRRKQPPRRPPRAAQTMEPPSQEEDLLAF